MFSGVTILKSNAACGCHDLSRTARSIASTDLEATLSIGVAIIAAIVPSSRARFDAALISWQM